MVWKRTLFERHGQRQAQHGRAIVFMLALRILLSFLFMGSAFSSASELPAPPPLRGTDGASFELTNYAQRPVLINFWASWCAPCRVEMPDLNDLQSQFDSNEFTIIGVAADQMAAVNDYLKSVPVNYPIYSGDPDQVFGWSEQLGNRVLGLPFSVLLDHAGKIRWVKMGGRIHVEDLLPLLTKLLEEKTTTGEQS